MKAINKYSNTCPSITEFESFLKNQITIEEKTQFNLHLNECELCSTAIEGYKFSGITDISNLLEKPNKKFKTKSKNSYLSYPKIAASVAILISIGISSFYLLDRNNWLNTTQNLMSENNFTQFTTYEITGVKRLSKKTTDQYLYLGENKTIAINDQFINEKEITNSSALNGDTKRIIIQVESTNHDQSNELINQIKEQHNIPVFTIRNIR